MTLETVYDALKILDLPVAYRQFGKGEQVAVPYMVYYSDGEHVFYADNDRYYCTLNVTLELYTQQKEVALEQKIETLLSHHGWVYTKTETYVESEHLIMTIYELEEK